MATDARITQGAAEVALDESVTPAARVSQGAIEASIDEAVVPATRVSHAAIEVAVVGAPPEEITTDTRYWSSVALLDPSTYYGGYKEPRVLSFGRATRVLSDLSGQWESNNITLSVSDTDRTIRGIIESAPKLLGTQVVVRMISEIGRTNRATPWAVFRGPLTEFALDGQLGADLTFRDRVAERLSGREDKMLPSRLVTGADFPAASPDVLGTPVPIIYGWVADVKGNQAQAAGLCPTIYVGQMTLDGANARHTWLIAGHAVNAITGAYIGNPTDKTYAPITAWGTEWWAPGYAGWWSGHVYIDINQRRYTLMQGSGTDADAVVDGSRTLNVNVKGIETVGDGTGDLITQSFLQYAHFMVNWVLQSYTGGLWLDTPKYEPGWCQINTQSWYEAQQETQRYLSGVTADIQTETFTALDASGKAAPWQNRCFHNGASGGGFTVYRWIFVTAIDNNGDETVISNMGDVHGDQDPGNIYSFVTWKTPLSGDVASYRVYCTNTLSDAMSPPFDPRNPVPADAVYVDDADAVPHIYYKTKDATPNGGSWPPDNNHDHELLYLNETDGTQYVNTVTTPDVPISSDGYTGQAYIGPDAKSIRDWIADWNNSLGCRLGLNKYLQWEVSVIPAVMPTMAQSFTDWEHVLKGSLKIEPRFDELRTRVTARAFRVPRDDYPDFVGTETYYDAATELTQEEAVPDELEIPFLDYISWTVLSPAAEDVAKRWLTFRSAGTLYYVQWETDICGLRADTGDIVKLTHFSGIGASGYRDRLIQIDRVELDIDQRKVLLGGYDVTHVWDTDRISTDLIPAPTGASVTRVGVTLGSSRYGTAGTTLYYKLVPLAGGEEGRPLIFGPVTTDATYLRTWLRWDAYSAAGADGLRLYRAEDVDFSVNLVKCDLTQYPAWEAPGNARVSEVHGTPGSTTYTYAVRHWYYLNGFGVKSGDFDTDIGNASLGGDNYNVLDYWEDVIVDTGLATADEVATINYGRSSSSTWLDESGGWYKDDGDDTEKGGEPRSTVTPGEDLPITATSFYDMWPGKQDEADNPWVSVP